MLLALAREALRSHFSGRPLQIPEAEGALLEPRPVFVSIHDGHELRGCIGNIEPSEPLYTTVAQCAVSAATSDPRFTPLTAHDVERITLEISVLSPMEPVQQPEEIEVGKHGLFIMKMRGRGLLMPQVATEHGWDRERFLAETCRKAGLGPYDWKEGASIHRFTAQVFGDSNLHAA